jgi:hypothetical protein
MVGPVRQVGERELFAVSVEDGFVEKRVGRVGGWAGSDAVVAVDGEPRGVECAVVERVPDEDFFWTHSHSEYQILTLFRFYVL